MEVKVAMEVTVAMENQTVSSVTRSLTIVDVVVVAGEMIIMIVTLFGNALVIAAIHRFPKLRNTTNKLVYSLALSDIGVGLCLPFLILFNLSPQLKEHKMACIFRYQLIIAMASLSQFTLVLVSVDRFVAIQFPLRYHALLSRRRISAMIAFVWVYSILIAVIPIFGLNEWDRDSWAKCELEHIVEAPYAMTLVLHFFICALIMTFLYGRVFYLARDHAQRIKLCTEHSHNATSHPSKGRISKATMTLFLVLGIFILSWLPFYTIFGAYEILRLRGTLDPRPQKILIYLRMVTSIIGLANSMWNPMIYAGKNRDFRMAFKKLLGAKSNNSHELLHLNRTSVVSNPAVIY